MPSPSDRELQATTERLDAEIAALRRSRRRLVEAHSADRRALERSLHDGLQQRLVALAVDVQQLVRFVEREPARTQTLLAEMATGLREASQEATALARMIFPPSLEGRGLAVSLRSAAADAGVTVLVDVPADPDVAPGIGAAMYWTCAEALASASPGSEAKVAVRVEDAAVTFDVIVVGRYDAALVDRWRDRIEALDGRLTVDLEGAGSRVQGLLPLSR